MMLQKAEFKALQFQVNPHFLFNALNTVAFVCREDGDRARELLITLADYFRYNLDYDAYMAPLQKELEHVENYLELERARFEDKLIVTYEVPEWMEVMVPILILQPIVENAVRYGISPDGRRIVDIQILENAGEYVVRISDKGRGFPEEVLKKLEKDEPIGNSIGLSNVHKRLKSIYGEEHGLKITSTPQGSTVEIHFFKTMIQQKK
jgi:LytS/YehU family sensor histidine kinase